MLVYALHAPEGERLAEVEDEMRELGAPSIRVVDGGDFYIALEGSHRLAAAAALGIEPELVVFEQNDTIDVTDFDWYEPEVFDDEDWTAGEVAGGLLDRSAVAYDFSF